MTGGQSQALERHDPRIDQQVVLSGNIHFAGTQAKDVAGPQHGRAEGVDAAGGAGHAIVAAYPLIPAHREQHAQQPSARNVRRADVRRLQRQSQAGHRVLHLQPCKRQRLLVDDLDRERYFLAEERPSLTEYAAVPQAVQAVPLPQLRHAADQQEDDCHHEQLPLPEQQAHKQEPADQPEPGLTLHGALADDVRQAETMRMQ